MTAFLAKCGKLVSFAALKKNTFNYLCVILK